LPDTLRPTVPADKTQIANASVVGPPSPGGPAQLAASTTHSTPVLR
jgi:hypothetical protein